MFSRDRYSIEVILADDTFSNPDLATDAQLMLNRYGIRVEELAFTGKDKIDYLDRGKITEVKIYGSEFWE